MCINVVIAFSSQFGEPIHVELPDEGCQVAMLEIFGENIFCKPTNIHDIESISCVIPGYKKMALHVLNYAEMYIKNLKEFGDKDGGLGFAP